VGPLAPLGLVLAVSEYELHFQTRETPRGLVTLSGIVATPEAFEAFRFLTLDVERTRFDGRDALAGPAWGPGGPHVLTWREEDGLVVRLIGTATDAALVEDLARRTRDLNRNEWVELVETARACPAAEATRSGG
jgi:hypothetical protein